MTLGVRDGRTYLPRQYHRGALTLLRPLYLHDDDEATVTVINPGGGYLGGDVYEVDVEVEAGAAAIVSTQSATRVYRTPNEPAAQRTRLRVDDGACLTYVPDELIAFADARYRQHTEVVLHAGATLFARDVITPGWSPDGQRFRYDRVHTILDVRDAGGRLLVRDNLLLEPGSFGIADRPGVLGAGATHVGSLLVVSPHLRDGGEGAVEAARLVAEAAAPGAQVGVSALAVPGLVVRVLGDSTAEVTRATTAVIDHLRGHWFDRAPLIHRKY